MIIQGSSMETIFPGVVRTSYGTPDTLTPIHLRQYPVSPRLSAWNCDIACPLAIEEIQFRATSRGCELQIPLCEDEELYGFGLQFYGLRQRGQKKTLRVNADALGNTDDSHAPVPFYVSTRGYGILVDTARYATFYTGSAQPLASLLRQKTDGVADATQARSAEELYASVRPSSAPLLVEIPVAAGVDIYVFWGEEMLEAVQRYNLFSGGGCVPPRWGLGMWYRARSDFDASQVKQLADDLRADAMPCDVLGFEPGWQTQVYPCSFEWSTRFPEPKTLLEDLKSEGFRVNLWTHAFTHPAAPLAESLRELSGDYGGFKGLVPDFALPRTREIIASHHRKTHVEAGVSGYKLDECDNSDYTGGWSFPELSRFPSGLDGEQMHSMLGALYQKTIDEAFETERTYGAVRSSGALASPLPFVLYSDLYDHRVFVRALLNSGFSGLLWTPEVRDARDTEDLIRRIQTTIFSAQALINAWYIALPPWKQHDTDLNNAGTWAEDWQQTTAICRDLFSLRMQLVPYLQSAFVRYRREGLPPFRALALDYPHDDLARACEDQWLVGNDLMVAPVFAGQSERTIYLPQGDWFDFWSGERLSGNQQINRAVPLETIPVFVRDGAILPLAQPTLHTDDAASRALDVRVYGDGRHSATLWNDDGSRDGLAAIDADTCGSLQLNWSATMQQEDVIVRGETFYSVASWQLFNQSRCKYLFS